MKRKNTCCLVVALLLTLCAGCMPRLASRPLTEEELEWSRIIRPSYPSWRPPYYSPATPQRRAEPSGYRAPLPTAAPRLEPPRAEPEGGEVELVPVDPQN